MGAKQARELKKNRMAARNDHLLQLWLMNEELDDFEIENE